MNKKEELFKLNRIKRPRIAVLRALHLGDLMCSIPAVRALRNYFPQAHISLIGLPWAIEFIRRFPKYFDDLYEFPGYPGIPERLFEPSQIISFIQMIQHQQFDFVLQMQGDGTIANSLITLFGAKNSAGFYLPGEYCPTPKTFMIYPWHQPEIHKHISLMKFLEIPVESEELEFPLTESDYKELNKNKEMEQLRNKNYICIHPGARVAERRWEPEKFAYVADRLVESGFTLVLTGTKEEIPLAKKVSDHMKYKPVDMTGKTSLGSLGAIISKAKLLICNDTGVSHVSDALRVPSVVIFLLSDPTRWASLDEKLHRAIKLDEANNPKNVVNEALDLLKNK